MYSHKGLELPKQAEHIAEKETLMWSREKDERLLELGQQCRKHVPLFFFIFMIRLLAEEKVRKSLLCPNR